MQRALVVHFSVAVPLTVLLMLLTPILKLMGQQPEIAVSAGAFGVWLLPSVWAWAGLWVLVPWLQAQGIVRPQMLVAAAIAAAHPFFLWTLVHALHGGMIGAAAANSLSLTANVSLLATAVFTCRTCVRTVPLLRPTWSACARLLPFLRLGLAGVLMMGE